MNWSWAHGRMRARARVIRSRVAETRTRCRPCLVTVTSCRVSRASSSLPDRSARCSRCSAAGMSGHRTLLGSNVPDESRCLETVRPARSAVSLPIEVVLGATLPGSRVFVRPAAADGTAGAVSLASPVAASATQQVSRVANRLAGCSEGGGSSPADGDTSVLNRGREGFMRWSGGLAQLSGWRHRRSVPESSGVVLATSTT